MSPTTHTLETAVAGLHATEPESLPFAPELDIRAFVLERPQGNLLEYASPMVDTDRAAIEALGPVEGHYLNHWHEAMFASDWPRESLFVHEAGRGEVEQRDLAVRGTWSKRFTLDDDFEAIPIPGHTPDATAFLWDSGEHRMLFTGDSLYVGSDGEWEVAVLDSSDPPPYRESLELIRDLEFDVLVPWAAPGGEPFVTVTSQAETRRRIDAIIASRDWS